jgi:mannosyl-3-phosphoglycerate phosphatase
MLAVITDLDATLLDHETYDYAPAEDALRRLDELRIPLVLNSSKTRAEMELWRWRLRNNHPFIAENGGAIFSPVGYFPFEPENGVARDGYIVIDLGAPYERLVEALNAAARESGCGIRGFHMLSAEGVAELCDMPLDQARLAKAREYDEAFQVLTPGREDRLIAAIERRGLHWTRGGRFHHILGDSDKARAVRLLRGFYERQYGQVKLVGLGDGLNDAAFLRETDYPVLMPSPNLEQLRQAVPGASVAPAPGPAGWSESVLRLLEDYAAAARPSSRSS